MRLNVGQIPGTVLPFHKLVLVALGAKGRETSTCHGRTLLSIIHRYDRMRKGGTRGRLTDMERAMRKPTSRFASVCGVVAVLCLSGLRRAQDFVPVTDQMLLDPDPADCLMVHRTYDFQGFSPLNQIDRSNVDQLQLAWMRAMDEGPQEIRPLVYDGVMYIAHPNGDHIQALEATTGDLVWNYERDLPDELREDPGLSADGPPRARLPMGTPGTLRPRPEPCLLGNRRPSALPEARAPWDVGDRTPCELYSNSTLAMNADTGEIDWYYQYLPCDDWDQDFVQERTLIDTVVNPDPEAVRWINPKLAGTAEERKIVVVMGEPGGLFVNDRETGEFLWASPLPYTTTDRFVIRDIDVETGAVHINMDLVAREIGQRFVICGHNVKGWWSWSYSPVTQVLYIPLLTPTDCRRAQP